jgi:hypothetical protein
MTTKSRNLEASPFKARRRSSNRPPSHDFGVELDHIQELRQEVVKEMNDMARNERSLRRGLFFRTPK